MQNKKIFQIVNFCLFWAIFHFASNADAASEKILRFMPSWTNTSAILLQNGNETYMKAVENYCGWFEAKATAPEKDFYVGFKQAVGNTYSGSTGNTKNALSADQEILLDSIAAISDTLWIIGNESDIPELYAEYPQRLGDCPVKNIPVMLFDWHHGNGSNSENAKDEGTNADFGSGGCGGKLTTGMVEEILGANGVPKRADPFPSSCKITEHVDYWFLPEVVATDANGKEYTNATCRNLELSLTDDGFWKGQKNKESPEGGMFMLDDFEFLDDNGTVKNPNFDQLKGSNGKILHNFGFTMKIHAKFEYVPGQYFEFVGDDDVWVFINNRLVVDIGGQHAELNGAVDLDTLGLTEGEVYPFHIFYAERHTGSSNFMMRTSIDLHTDASIFLTGEALGDIKFYDIWQIVKQDALSCDFSESSMTQVDTAEGSSIFKLTGGNLGENGILLDSAGAWFEGIVIDPSFTKFSIDSSKIVNNATLAPGHYYLQISLRNNPSQVTGIWITVPRYTVPTTVFADSAWNNLGKDISGDTLQPGRWAYEKYKVNVMFEEDWAQVTLYNKNLALSVSNPLVSIIDEVGNPVSKVALDSSGKASFYLLARGAVSDVALQVKGAASSSATWTKIRFDEPPIPHAQTATVYDRNGDGRGDSLYALFDKPFDEHTSLDAIQILFGEDFPRIKIDKLKGNTLEVVAGPCETEKTCGFGNLQFTGDIDNIYTGSMSTDITYTEDDKEYHFSINGIAVNDGIGPIIKSASKKISDTYHVLHLTLSEGISDSSLVHYSDMFLFNCVRGNTQQFPQQPNSYVKTANNQIELVFLGNSDRGFIPDVGDQVRFQEDNAFAASDLSGIKPHKKNPWVPITGDQEMTVTSTGIVNINEENPIVQSDSATVPILITDIEASAKGIAEQNGVQGHLVGFDAASLITDKTKQDIAKLDAFIQAIMGNITLDTAISQISRTEATNELFADIASGNLGGGFGISDTVLTAINEGIVNASNYSTNPLVSTEDKAIIESLIDTRVEEGTDTTITSMNKDFPTIESFFDAVKNGTISKETLEENGISQLVVRSIKSGELDASTIGDYRNADASLIKPEEIKFTYSTTYYSHLGHFVNSQSGSIDCNDPVYQQNGTAEDNCISNNGNIFLAWNMKSSSGRLVATGVYIARLEIKITIADETISHQTRDFLWGVRRSYKGQ